MDSGALAKPVGKRPLGRDGPDVSILCFGERQPGTACPSRVDQLEGKSHVWDHGEKCKLCQLQGRRSCLRCFRSSEWRVPGPPYRIPACWHLSQSRS